MLAHYRVMRSLIPQMRDGGSIIFTATLVTGMGNVGESAYASAKSGVVGLTKAAAMELAPRRIRVNAINPGATEGAMWPSDHPQRDLIELLCPLGRLGEPDEIAALCQFLAADDCQFLTGQNIFVDGGLTAGFAPQMLEQLMGGVDGADLPTASPRGGDGI